MDSRGMTRCGSSRFYWGERTYIMGILNASPDSFSGDGVSTVDAAAALGERMLREGADVIDVGGESTRPGASPVSPDEEMRRVVPVIEKLARLGAPVSIDTSKPEVAQSAVQAGACMINDVWGLKRGARLAGVAATAGIPIILMSNQRDATGDIPDIMAAVIADLERAMVLALGAGVPRRNLIVDPGIGFGKSEAQNLEIVARLGELKRLGAPILLGSSRKFMKGVPFSQRLGATAATVAIGIANGADFVRVHEVEHMAQVCRMSDAIVRRGHAMVYLSLGSNMGDRRTNLQAALDALSDGLRLGRCSAIYDTAPVDNVDQPRFLNMTCQGFTDMTAAGLLDFVKGIEVKLGRAPGTHNLPRPIDIDILFYGASVLETPDLVIPHPRLHQRAFVLIPLAEIAPELQHPVLKKTVRQLLEGLGDTAALVKPAG